MTKVFTFANQKGGVGKTTSAVNIGAFLSVHGRSVLVVDIDPQANATSSLGLDKQLAESLKNGERATIYNALIENTPVTKIIQTTRRPRLHLVPSSPILAGAEVELVGMFAREMLLRKALAPVLQHYDYVLVDTPPSLGLLTVNAMCASRELLIPMQCEYFAMRGIRLLLDTLDRVKSRLKPDLELNGILATMYSTGTVHAREVLEEIRSVFEEKVFDVVIYKSIRFAEASVASKAIVDYASRHKGARAYKEVARLLVAQQEGEQA